MYARTIPLFLLLVLAACGDGVTDARSARAAYLGLDAAVEKALNLGFKGFNEATSANIPPQATTGDVRGTMDVTGKVDQGASANKGMRLDVALTEYQDFAVIRTAPSPALSPARSACPEISGATSPSISPSAARPRKIRSIRRASYGSRGPRA